MNEGWSLAALLVIFYLLGMWTMATWSWWRKIKAQRNQGEWLCEHHAREKYGKRS